MAIKRIEITKPEFNQRYGASSESCNTSLLTIHSNHIHGRQDVSVYHEPTTQKNIPIVVLLHGVYGSNWVWMHLGGVHKVYQQLREQGLSEFVLVMPSDGGLWDGSAYLPLKEGNYEQWIIDDVLTATVDHIASVSEQSNVYICGLSMGGYGALRLGAKYADRFSGISAHSSVTNLADLQQFIANPISDYQCDSAVLETSVESDILHWCRVNHSSLPPMRLDCGVDDTLYQSNLALVEAFKSLDVKFEFEAFSGGHAWEYWHEHVGKSLLFFDQIEKSDTNISS